MMNDIFQQGMFQVNPDSTPDMLARKRAQISRLMSGRAKYTGEGLAKLATGVVAGIKGRNMDTLEGEKTAEATEAFNRAIGAPSTPQPMGQAMAPQGAGTPFAAPEQGTPFQPKEAAMGARNVAMASNGGPTNAAAVAAEATGGFSEGGIKETAPKGSHLEVAASAIGLNESDKKAALQDFLRTGGQNIDPATTAWCAAFVDATLRKSGGKGTGKLNARSYLDWGKAVDTPQKGDVAVFSRGDPNGWQGHVGFYQGTNADGTFNILGGNQGDAVSVKPYSSEKLLGFRRADGSGGGAAPSGGGMQMPPQRDMTGLYQALQNPWLNPQQKAVITSMIAQQQGQTQAMQAAAMKQQDPLYQAQLAKMQADMNAPEPRQMLKGADGRTYYVDTGEPVLPNVQVEAEQGYEILTPEAVKAMGLPEGAYQRSADGKVSKIGGGGVTVNNIPADQPNIGTVPQGYSVVKDESEPSGYRMVPISGGPEDTTKNDAQALANKQRSGKVVTEDIQRAIKIAEQDGAWTTGIGAVLKNVPGTQAKSLDGLLQTIKANVGFDRLQQMRDASKTGGALGAINKTEMDLLQSVLGNLEQSLSSEDLVRNLQRVNQVYNEIIHGPSGAAPAVSQDFSAMDLSTISQIDLGTLSGPELDAWEARMKELGY